MKNEQMALLFSEATPYIQKYHGKTLVIKYGGNAMVNDDLKLAVMNDLVTLTLLGVRVVLVHGGGALINSMLKKVGKESKFVGGLRYTDEGRPWASSSRCWQGRSTRIWSRCSGAAASAWPARHGRPHDHVQAQVGR